MLTRLLIGLIVTSALLPPGLYAYQAQKAQADFEARAIQKVRSARAGTIERGLPDEIFEAWFSRAAGPGARISWEVNDCGEQTGDPKVDRLRDIPLCVEAAASLPDGRTAGASIMVGSEKKGLSGPLAVNVVYIAGKDTPPVILQKLADLPARMRPAR